MDLPNDEILSEFDDKQIVMENQKHYLDKVGVSSEVMGEVRLNELRKIEMNQKAIR